MRKTMTSSKILDNTILVIVIVYLLWCMWITFTYLTQYLWLSFLKRELSFWEILNSITAISLAFLIPFFVEKRFSRNKTLWENFSARLTNLQKELEFFIVDIGKNCSSPPDASELAHCKFLITLKLRKIGLNINWFRKDSPIAFGILFLSFAQFRKLTTPLIEPTFNFDNKFYQDTYLRYIDFDKCIEDAKLWMIDMF